MDIDRGLFSSGSSDRPREPRAPTSAVEHLETLRRVTRDMASAQKLPALLGSITQALVEHAGAAIARITLYESDADCDICRAGPPAGALRSEGAKCLHHAASAGEDFDIAGPYHLIPLTVTSFPGKIARERRAWLVNDLTRDVDGLMFAERETLLGMGITAAGGYPLEFRGELLGVLGMAGRRPFETRAFELLSIFADQAAMAIKSAQLFRELARYEQRLHEENSYLQEEIRHELGFEDIVGKSAALRQVLRQVKQVAPVETTVLLTGETGTGKELIARAIHALSPRRGHPLIKMNCGAIPQGVVESELFGHERGAFTGALQRRPGRFELADKGTLFMDEVGELPADTQIKLLRVLQEQEFERVGSNRPIRVDVRVITATNRDLEQEVAEGRFRADLFYRLNVFPVHVPPLRERASDIPLLVRHFVAHFRRKMGRRFTAVTPESLERLQRYPWPGNIRELQNVVERACVLTAGGVVDIPESLLLPGTGAEERGAAHEEPILTLDDAERALVRRALAATSGRIHGPDGAAALLGLNGNTLRSRMQKLGIPKHVS